MILLLAGKPLQGPLAGRRSLQVGDIRIVYRLEAEAFLVFVLDIARRDKAYRDLRG
jgi:mRNA-degrading endonuclease RelE of RelBE toxin-antitoxin system